MDPLLHHGCVRAFCPLSPLSQGLHCHVSCYVILLRMCPLAWLLWMRLVTLAVYLTTVDFHVLLWMRHSATLAGIKNKKSVSVENHGTQ